MTNFSSGVSLTVLSTGFDGTGKSILIDSGATRYLVNCGEGIQRVLCEHKSKGTRINHVLFTQVCWDHVSGLLGVALSARAAGVESLTVHGPPVVEKLMQLTRHFADSATTDIIPSSILEAPYVDNVFKIHAFPVSLPPSTLYDSSEPPPKQPRVEEHPLTTYIYYFQTFQQRRKLDVAKCRILGVPKSIMNSPAVRDLINGDGVTLADGRFIASDDVTSPSFRCPNFLVIDCPTAKLLPEIERHKPFWDSLVTIPTEQNLKAGVSFIVHLLPPGLFSTEEYQNFINRISNFLNQHSTVTKIDSTEVKLPESLEHQLHHLVMDGTGCLPHISGIYSQSTILHHYFDAQVYPKLYNMRSEERKKSIAQALTASVDPFSNVVYAQPQLQYHIRPWIGYKQLQLESMKEADLLEGAFDQYIMTRSEAEAQFAQMRAAIDKDIPLRQCTSPNPHCSEFDPSPNETATFPRITFFGTASSCPNKYRNVTCILVQTGPDDYVMLDCGEGSLYQMYAFFGPERAQDILRRLKLVLLSHMHADHHGGLITVALARSRLIPNADAEKLAVLAPPAYIRWMTSYQDWFHSDSILSLFVVPEVYCSGDSVSPKCLPRLESSFQPQWQSLLNKLKLEIHPIKVPHTFLSWAYLLRGNPAQEHGVDNPNKQWSLVFSGDTPECMDLAEVGRDCDILIHEATMVEEHEELAKMSKHSTIESAIRIGKAMNAKYTILTHFSQRYGRVPLFDSYQPNVLIAFDFMQVTINDLKRLAYFVPYYKYAFAKHFEMSKVKTENFRWRKLREAGKLDSGTKSSDLDKEPLQAKQR